MTKHFILFIVFWHSVVQYYTDIRVLRTLVSEACKIFVTGKSPVPIKSIDVLNYFFVSFELEKNFIYWSTNHIKPFNFLQSVEPISNLHHWKQEKRTRHDFCRLTKSDFPHKMNQRNWLTKSVYSLFCWQIEFFVSYFIQSRDCHDGVYSVKSSPFWALETLEFLMVAP